MPWEQWSIPKKTIQFGAAVSTATNLTLMPEKLLIYHLVLKNEVSIVGWLIEYHYFSVY